MGHFLLKLSTVVIWHVGQKRLQVSFWGWLPAYRSLLCGTSGFCHLKMISRQKRFTRGDAVANQIERMKTDPQQLLLQLYDELEADFARGGWLMLLLETARNC